jgi:hypothetical protein
LQPHKPNSAGLCQDMNDQQKGEKKALFGLFDLLRKDFPQGD